MSLIGTLLIHERQGVPDRVARIVEVEAYGGPEDRASHARAGRTRRTAPMFGPPGLAYVYLVYGMYHCLNVVTGVEGEAGAILIRSVEPVAGIEAMRSGLAEARARRRAVRSTSGHGPAGRVPDQRIAAGPGRLCAAFGIDRSFTGIDVCSPASALRIEQDSRPDARAVIQTPRIGIGYAGEPWASVPWRLVVTASRSISGPRPLRRGPD